MKEVLLIDHGSVYWAAWHSSVNDEVSAAHDRCVEHVRKLAGEMRAVAICCDSPVSKRREQHPEYKAQRPAKDHASIDELRRTKDTLRRDGFLLWEHEGYEADDVIASAVRAAPSDCAITIASADKDLLQLVADANPDAEGPAAVRVVSTKTGAVLGPEDVKKKLGVRPALVRDWLALVGDKSDNVTGVPGIGDVKAAALLNAFGSIDATIRALQNNATHELFKPALSASLRDPKNLENLVKAQQLVTLVDTLPVAFGEIFEERQVQPLEPVASGEFDDDDDAPAVDSTPKQASQPPPPPATAPVPVVPEPAQPSPPAAATGVALARVAPQQALAPVAAEQQLQPTNLKGAFLLAQHLYNSRLYSRYPSQEAIFAVIIRGREMGLTALTALDSFHIIEGKPCPGAHLLITLAKQHPDCEYFRFVGGDATYAEYVTKRRDSPTETRLRYTIEDAKQAGLMPEQPKLRRQGEGKDTRSNWEKRPAEMLRKTCGVQLARIEYPEALGGLYSQEEMAA
jgi:5'-3' exonuclease